MKSDLQKPLLLNASVSSGSSLIKLIWRFNLTHNKTIQLTISGGFILVANLLFCEMIEKEPDGSFKYQVWREYFQEKWLPQEHDEVYVLTVSNPCEVPFDICLQCGLPYHRNQVRHCWVPILMLS